MNIVIEIFEAEANDGSKGYGAALTVDMEVLDAELDIRAPRPGALTGYGDTPTQAAAALMNKLEERELATA